LTDLTDRLSARAHHPWRQRVVGSSLIAGWLLVKAFSPWAYFGTEQPMWGAVISILSSVGLIVGVTMLFASVKNFDRSYELSNPEVALFRGFSTLIVAAAVVQSIAFGFPTVRGTLPGPARYIMIGAYALVVGTAAIACLLSLSLTWRAADRPGTRALALFMALVALFWGPVLSRFWVEYQGGSINFGSTFGGDDSLSDFSQAIFLLAVAAFLRFSALFPRRLTEDDIIVSRLARPLGTVRRYLLRPGIVWGVAVGLTILVMQRGSGQSQDRAALAMSDIGPSIFIVIAMIVLLSFGLPLLGMAAGAMNLRTSYLSSDEAERKKILWVLVGCVGGTIMVLAAVGGFFLAQMPAFGFTGFLSFGLPLSPLVLVLSLAFAMFYTGSVHPALVIRRSTVYGVLGVLLIAALSAAESLLSEILEDALGFSSLVSTACLGGVIAVILVPLRAPLARWLGPLLPSDGG